VEEVIELTERRAQKHAAAVARGNQLWEKLRKSTFRVDPPSPSSDAPHSPRGSAAIPSASAPAAQLNNGNATGGNMSLISRVLRASTVTAQRNPALSLASVASNASMPQSPSPAHPLPRQQQEEPVSQKPAPPRVGDNGVNEDALAQIRALRRQVQTMRQSIQLIAQRVDEPEAAPPRRRSVQGNGTLGEHSIAYSLRAQ
jgi:hypothetical protein